MSKIKVLHCITDLSPDGAQRTLLRLITALNPARFELRVVSLRDGGELAAAFASAGFPVTTLGMSRGVPNPLGLLRLRSIIRAWQPHLVQGWMYHGNLAALLAVGISGYAMPVLWNVRRCLYDISRDRLGTRWTIRAGARLSGWVSRIVYCVERAAIQHEAIGFDPSRRAVIPNGFDLMTFKPISRARSLVRRELGLREDAVVIGAIGRYHPQKDFRGLLHAAAAVVRTGHDVHFALVGRGVTPENKVLTRMIEELGLLGRVHRIGERTDIPAILSALDLFVSSSENEGFSNVLGEAMACGVPCVATDVGAAREVLLGLGSLVPAQDPSALAGAIEAMLALSSERRREIGLHSRIRIEQGYSSQRMVEQYEALYTGLVDGAISMQSREAYRVAA